VKHRRARWHEGPVRRRLAAGLGVATGLAAVGVGGHLMLAPPRLTPADAGAVPVGAAPARPAPGQAAAPAPGSAPLSPADLPRATTPDPGPVTPVDPAPGAAASAVPVSSAAPGRVPVAFRAADVDVLADVVATTVEPSGALEIPRDAGVLGWWSSGAASGASAGSVVLAGHVDSTAGVGVMRALLDLPMESVVEVVDEAGGTTLYRVVARRTFDKSQALPPELFRADGPPQLVLITCGGTFDEASGHYSDNVVLYGVPA